MAERLNYDVVEGKLSSFNSSCDSLYNALKELDENVYNSLNSAIRGRLGQSLLNDWNDNCTMFLNFKGLFDEWHTAAVDICTQNSQFEQDSVEATETVYKDDVTVGGVL